MSSNQAELISQRVHTGKAAIQARSKFKLGDSTTNLLIGAIFPVFVLVIWQLLGELGLISEVFLPTPIIIAKAFSSLITSGELFIHIRISVLRAAGGFLLG